MKTKTRTPKRGKERKGKDPDEKQEQQEISLAIAIVILLKLNQTKPKPWVFPTVPRKRAIILPSLPRIKVAATRRPGSRTKLAVNRGRPCF